MQTTKRLLFSQQIEFFVFFGNFVIKNHPNFTKIGNFVIKNKYFGPFSALAKNLTMASRPNEMKQTDKTKSPAVGPSTGSGTSTNEQSINKQLKIGDQNHVSN